MNDLPPYMTFRRVRFKLEAAGFGEIKQLGNHAKFVKREGDQIKTAILPHYTQLSASTVASIIKQTGLTREEFDSL